MLSSRVRSAGESRSMRLRSRSARSAWRRDTIDCPAAVRDNIEARPSHGSGLRSISPSRSSFATADVSAGCLICSVLTRSLSRHGPTLDRVCSTDSAEKLSRSELPSEKSRDLYAQYLHDKDDRMRAAAAEGYARLRHPEDLPMLEKAWQDEGKTSPRLSLAFAQVMLGQTGTGEFSPLQYLIDTLNSAAYKGEAFPFLVELARDGPVRDRKSVV